MNHAKHTQETGEAVALQLNPVHPYALQSVDLKLNGHRPEPHFMREVVKIHTEQGARMASAMPWMIFLSAGQIVASTPPSSGRAASPSPATK